MQGGVPNPRWAEYIQELDENGKALGFKLPNNPFLFRYDEQGGWQDENGIHYNADGIADSQPDSQSDEEDDEDELPAHDYGLVDDLEELLREEEEGIVRSKKVEKVEKEEKEVKPVVAGQNQKEDFDFGKLLEEFKKSAERLRKGIPAELFIYFRQKAKYYERVNPEVENKGNVEEKQKVVRAIKEAIAKKREELIAKNDWLKQEGVFLDYSGDSDQVNFYDRYWYGYLKTTAERYLDVLAKIGKSEQFKILEIKTYYALKSKLYLKKGQEKILAHIAGLRQKIEAIDENHTVTFTFDGLPEQFPISFVYDLVEYAGGKWEEVESVEIKDDFSASVVCLKHTALQVINIQGYNHDKGQFLEISLQSTQPKKDRKFYYIRLDSEFKIHERQLNDTLALEPSREELAKHCTKQQEEKQRFRFVIGSIPALKRVLMFRGESMNIITVTSK